GRAVEVATIHVGYRHDVNPRGLAVATRAVELVRADLDQRCRIPVIRGIEDDQVALARVRAREAQRQLVRLAAGVDEVADPQRLRRGPPQPFREAGQMLVEIARVRVQGAQLPGRRLDHARVTVADVGNVVVRVDVAAAGFVE